MSVFFAWALGAWVANKQLYLNHRPCLQIQLTATTVFVIAWLSIAKRSNNTTKLFTIENTMQFTYLIHSACIPSVQMRIVEPQHCSFTINSCDHILKKARSNASMLAGGKFTNIWKENLDWIRRIHFLRHAAVWLWLIWQLTADHRLIALCEWLTA